MSNIARVESYINSLTRNRELAMQLNNSAHTRLVWLVGIDAFALLNAHSYWESLKGHPLVSIDIVWLSVPWVLSALCGVMAHYLIDVVVSHDNIYYTRKITASELHKIGLSGNNPDPDEFLRILDDTDPDTKREKDVIAAWTGWANFFERATFIALVAGFVWAVIGPLVLRSATQ